MQKLVGGSRKEVELEELKVSLPISRLRGEKERERHHKKHKKHKEKRRNEQAVGGKTVSSGGKSGWPGGEEGERSTHGGKGEGERGTHGGKGEGERGTHGGKGEGERGTHGGKGEGERVSYGGKGEGERGTRGGKGEGERGTHGVKGEGERVSYGGKGEGERASHGGKGEGDRVSYGGKGKGERVSYGGKGEGDRASHGGKSLGQPMQRTDSVSGGGRGYVQQTHRRERPMQSHKEHPLSHSYTSHHPPPSHLPPSHPHPSLECRLSDKYHQHQRRVAPSLSHPFTEITSSHPHTVTAGTTSQTTPPEPHKHHKKKKKKKKHSKSHATDQPPLEPTHDTTLRESHSEERLQTPPTSELSSSSLEREICDLRPLSPPLPPAHHVTREKEGGWLAAKKVKLSSHNSADTAPSLSLTPSSPPPVPAPPSATTPISGKSGRGITGEATPPKRRMSSSRGAARGKQLWMVDLGSSEDEEEREDIERAFGGVITDYDPPPMALEQFQESSQSSHQPQGMCIPTHTHMLSYVLC